MKTEITGDLANKIAVDVGTETPIEKSKLNYTPEMRKFRAGVEQRYEKFKQTYPDAMLEVKE